MVPMGVSIGGVFVEISVFRHFIVDDEPLALGMFTASDVATERSESSTIPMATIAAMGARGWGVERR